MITRDGVEVQAGDKVWVDTQDGWHQVVVGSPYPWYPKFIVKARYSYASRKCRMRNRSITVALVNGANLSFQTLDHDHVHGKMRDMGVDDTEYTLHYDGPF